MFKSNFISHADSLQIFGFVIILLYLRKITKTKGHSERKNMNEQFGFLKTPMLVATYKLYKLYIRVYYPED